MSILALRLVVRYRRTPCTRGSAGEYQADERAELFVLPEVFTLVLGPSFDLPCLLATAILDSFSLFYLPNRRKWQSTPVLLLGKSHGQRSLVGYSLWGYKESDMTERLSQGESDSVCTWLLWLLTSKT